MDIAKKLHKGQSRAEIDKIIAYIGNDEKRLKVLMDLFFKGDEEVQRRAAWVVGEVGVLQPELIHKYIPNLIKKMKTKDLHCAIPRAIMRIFMNIKIPERYVSEVFDLSLENIRDESSSIAERAFSVKTAVNICEKHRELSNEFFIVLDDLRKYTSIPAIVSTMRYASKKLNR